ncbi:MAG: transglycosylase domain-containing protein [Microbacterium gubbeenense]|uniref:transglycosylase domain-containing protein n=1 Tax=Microbacterium gubbeenense TaxID=159896 RepID=UPI003F9B1E3E
MPHAKRTFGGVLGGVIGLVGLSAVAGILVTATVTPAIAVSGYAASSAISLFDSLPGNLQVDRPMEPTTIYAPTGEGEDDYYELASFYDQNREPVEYGEVSQFVYDALLSTEDPRYYEHGGVDLIGTGRALLSNAVTDTTQGGSSISQQYVKGVQVQTCERTATDQETLAECAEDATTADGTEGYQRKLQEMRYAITIEQDYSKEQILIGYLNLVNFGGSTYGIEAAAQRYFSKSAKDVNLNEAATLAGIVNYPSTLRLDQPENEVNGEADGYKLTKDRRDQVLGRMLAEGTITQEKYDETIEQPIEPKLKNRVQGCAAAGGTAYFCQYVKNTILHDERYAEAFGETPEERSDLLTRGGLDIYTTLDNNLQYEAQQSMARNVATNRDGMDLGAAAVQIDTHTGNILSLAQNTLFNESSETAPGESSLVYAADFTHGRSTGFSAGSTYKMFTIIDWLEQGRSANEYLDGRVGRTLPFTCHGSTSSYTTARGDNFANNGGSINSVRNFTGLSLNSGFYAMASQLDVCEIHNVADRMGVTLGNGDPISEFPGHETAFSVLGSANIAPIDIASAYATVANGGTRCEPTAILRADAPDGEQLPIPETKCERVLDENVAATTAYTMSRVMEGGQTGSGANVGDGIPTFGKTGTHEGIQSWMIQTTSNVTSAAWIGNASGGVRNGQGDLFLNGLDGIRYTMSREIQAAANAKYGGEAFPEPDPGLTKVVEKQVPNVSGMSVDEATSVLRGEGFQVRTGDSIPGEQDKGLVEGTNPSGKAPAGSLITLLISDGKGSIEIPDVSGMSPGKAYSELFELGLRVELTACKTNPDAPAGGRVTSTDPSAGTQVEEGATVKINREASRCNASADDAENDD